MILVTGATGFIGGYTVRALLDSGHEVVGMSRYGYRPETRFVLGDLWSRVPLVRADPRDQARLADVFQKYRPACVIHLDAYVNPVDLKTHPLRAIDHNFLATVNVLESARRFGVARIVFASSIAVLPTIRYQPVDANHPVITATEGPGGGFYGAAKAAAEIFGLTYSDSFDLDFRVVRPSAVYGFGMQQPLGIKPVVEGLVRGEQVAIAARAPLRDYTPVEDVAAVFTAVAGCAPAADRVFYAGTGRELCSSRDLYDAVRAVFPRGRVRWADTDLDPTGVESRYRGVLDMTPAREQLTLTPRFPDLASGLAHYAERYSEFRERHDAGRGGPAQD